MASNGSTGRPLGGEAGYRRLARLVGRAFYSGECPPKEAGEGGPAAAAQGQQQQEGGTEAPSTTFRARQFQKHDYGGLGVLCIDLLAGAGGYLHEEAAAATLRQGGKNVRRALHYLRDEGVVHSESVKKTMKRKNVEEPDDPEVEARTTQHTHTYWCIAYPSMRDMLTLRLHRMRDLLRRHAEDREPLQQYICRACGSVYSSLDAMRLLDPGSGTFRCEHDGSELIQHVEGADGRGTGTDRKAFARACRETLDKLEVQLRPVIEQLERLRDVEPPDYGSWRDWAQSQLDAERRRKARIEAARVRAAAGGVSADHMTDDQVLDWEVQVHLQGAGGAPTAAAAAPVPAAKELPAWFRGVESTATGATSDSVGPPGSAGEAPSAAAAGRGGGAQGADSAAAVQEAFLRQYMAQLEEARRAQATEEKDAKLEAKGEAAGGWGPQGGLGEGAAAGVKPEPEQGAAAGSGAGVAAAAGVAGTAAGGEVDEGLEWEDMEEQEQQAQQQLQQQGEPPPAQQQQQQQGAEAAAADEDDATWEDI